MTGRISSHSSDSSKAGTSKNTLVDDATKTTNISTGVDVHDKWSQSTVSFDFDKMHADDFPNFLNDDFSIHKNDEALLADFTALLEDGDDVIMTAGTANVSGDKEKEKEKELIKADANMSTSTSHSLNSSGGEILVTTDTRQYSEQLSQSIGSIMSDHDYLSREDILDIMNNDEENFFSQGNSKSIKLEHDSMDVNLSENIPPTLISQPPIDSVDSAAIPTENIAIEANLPTTPASDANDSAKSILANEVTPLLVKLTTATPTELIEALDELELKVAKLKKSLVCGSNSGETSSGIAGTTNGDGTIEPDRPAAPTMSECDSDAIFSCDRSEPLEYYGLTKEGNATTTDESGMFQCIHSKGGFYFHAFVQFWFIILYVLK